MRSFAVFLLLVLAVAAPGALFPPDVWYAQLVKPSWFPPNWLFAPVWGLLYLAITVAGWKLWFAEPGPTRRMALILWGAQLVLNGLWSPLFFGLHQPLWALVDILTLLAVLAASPGWFRHLSPLAAWLWLPYGLWVAYATALNAALVIGNPS